MNVDNSNKIPDKESSRIYVLFYSFFLIPFMIAVFGAVFFLLFRFITFETNSAEDLLNQVKIGSASKRWQSAFELAKILNNPDLIPLSSSFKDQMISAYERSIHDDPLVRSYLAMAMGATRDTTYGPHLLNGLNDDNLESQIAAIQSIGMIGYPAAVPQLKDITITSKYHNERLAATIALGMIGDHTSIPHLTSLLEDEEPNIRWDAAVALAKMGNDSGVPIITGLLDREYLGQFKEVDEIEKKQVLMVAIKISSLLIDERFKPKLITLAETDIDLSIRDAAIKTLEKKYKDTIAS
jgi:HEAT repeat protein